MTEHSFIPGQHVICSYRIPSPQQPWIHEIPVGIVVEPTKGFHAGFNEERYLEETEKIKVCYGEGYGNIQYDYASSLTPIPPEYATLSPREKVARFMGSDVLALYDAATRKEGAR